MEQKRKYYSYPRLGIIRIESDGSLKTLEGSLSIKGNASIVMTQIFERFSILRVQFGRENEMFGSFFLVFLSFSSFVP